MAPGEVDPDIQQRIAATTWTHEGQYPPNAISLALNQWYGLTRHMIGRGVHTKNEITRSDIITHPLPVA